MPEKEENYKFMNNLLQRIKTIQEKMKSVIAGILYDKDKLQKIDVLINKIFSDEYLDKQDKFFRDSLSKNYLKTLKSRGIKYLNENIISRGYLIGDKVYKEFINLLNPDDLLILKDTTETEIEKRRKNINNKKNKTLVQQEINNLKENHKRLSDLSKWYF